MEQSPNVLRRVPPEIRGIIFAHALTLSKSIHIKAAGKSRLYPTPRLLRALRGTPDLYGEALETFYQVNCFVLDENSFEIFSRLRIQAVQLIQKIRLVLSSYFRASDDFHRLFTYPKSNLARATGLRYLRIEIPAENPDIYSIFQSGMGNYIHLQKFRLIIKRLTLEAKNQQLKEQIINFVDEYFSREQRTKGWTKMDETLKGQNHMALRWA